MFEGLMIYEWHCRWVVCWINWCSTPNASSINSNRCYKRALAWNEEHWRIRLSMETILEKIALKIARPVGTAHWKKGSINVKCPVPLERSVG